MLHIVIPAYNEEGRLPRTLRDLRRYVGARRGVLGPVEVTVVDNFVTLRARKDFLIAEFRIARTDELTARLDELRPPLRHRIAQ